MSRSWRLVAASHELRHVPGLASLVDRVNDAIERPKFFCYARSRGQNVAPAIHAANGVTLLGLLHRSIHHTETLSGPNTISVAAAAMNG